MVKLLKFHIVLNVVVVLFITGASYVHTPLNGIRDTAIYLVHLVLLQSSLAGLLYFLSLSKWAFRGIVVPLFLVLCCFSFWGYTQDISFTPSIIQATVESTPDIVIDMLSWQYVLFISAAIVTIVKMSQWRDRITVTAQWKMMSVLALGCTGLYVVGEKIRPNSFENRVPFSIVKGLRLYYEEERLTLQTDVAGYTTTATNTKVIFVLGETVRADHLGLNGYERETTPLLSERDDIISFSKLRTEYTYTAKSVPQLLTNLNLGEDLKRPTAVYDVMKAAGIQTSWIGNQTLENSFRPIVLRNDTIVLIDAFKSEFSFDKAHDGAMLPYLDRQLKHRGNELITLHMIGSHWWYENRYPAAFRTFTPVISSKYVPSNSKEEMINAYDNTLVYLDYFLNSIIEKLEGLQGPSAFVFVADHGEMLGERGKWLHAQAGDEVKNPGYMLWFSPEYKLKYPEVVAHFLTTQNEMVLTDVVYDDLLKILSVSDGEE